MKYILLLFTSSLVLCVGCTSGQSSSEAAPSAGIYVSALVTEQCNIADTLELRLLRTKHLYRVSRRIGLWITKQDTDQCIRYNRTQWAAVYDQASHRLQGTDERPVIHYDPDANSLQVGGSTYIKTDSHVSN